MKTIQTTITILAIIIFTFSCSKDDAPAPIQPVVLAPLQDPLPEYLAVTGFDQKVTEIIDEPSNAERGFSFIPLINGKITAIVVKMPSVNNTGMRVTIWDKIANVVLRTETINITTPSTVTTKTITALDLLKNKEYFITFNSNDRYKREKTNGSNATYPFAVGDILITGFSYQNGSSQSMPMVPASNYLSGDCSFKFQK